MMKPRVWVSNGKNTIAIPQESLPAVIASIEPAVADIVAACAVQPSQGLLGLPTNTPLSLHLPAGVSRSNCGLSEDCFFTVDEADSMLDPGCPLTALGLGVKSKCALVIKVEKPDSGPPFDPASYKLEFPFFTGSSEYEFNENISLLGRDRITIQEMNDILSERRRWQKYRPLIVCSSQGTGKTFFLKCVGSQRLGLSLKCPDLVKAAAIGRVLSFDFSKHLIQITSVFEADSFLKQLMVFFLCRMFAGCEVDGIHFQFREFPCNAQVETGQHKFKEWLDSVWVSSTDHVMKEFMRLTDLAFGVRSDAPLVFLFDEVQTLCKSTEIPSKFREKITFFHTGLSILMVRLDTHQRPVCLCAGTSDGNIHDIVSYSCVIPAVFSLTSVVSEHEQRWAEMSFKTLNRKDDEEREMPLLHISHDSNMIAIVLQTLPAVLAGIDPVVGNLLAAFKTAVAPDLDSVVLTKLSLHLPEGFARSTSGLSNDCFLTNDVDSMLDPGCPLAALTAQALGVDSNCALVVRADKCSCEILVDSEVQVSKTN
ncbi:hypothetical protein BDR26DRAFT_865614 [Obelidium mucronatum]|nr:hypothetical protein BDR26DRAFT_865614 [Obelidium mucronatum]